MKALKEMIVLNGEMRERLALNTRQTDLAR
ncbi:hypothetical protein MAUB1S_06082 [Mycolicibacterium aubagnense]